MVRTGEVGIELKASPRAVADRGTFLFHSDVQCPNCCARGMDVFYVLDHVPVHSVMNVHSQAEALDFPTGIIELGFCRQCSFVSNIRFDPSLIAYSQNCEESQGYSKTFNAFLSDSTQNLIDRYDIRDKDIIEIGCGKGDFLQLICQLGNNRGLGFDPAYVPGRGGHMPSDGTKRGHVRFIQDYYSERYAQTKADVYICRMTLEHISRPYAFLEMIRESIGDSKSLVCFQVPNMNRILEECAFEDIYYEHCSYFTPEALEALFRLTGFEVLDVRIVYNDQYLMLEGLPSEKSIPGLKEGAKTVEACEPQAMLTPFVDRYREKIETYWKNRIDEMFAQGQKVVVWGSGSKGVAFLTTLRIQEAIAYVVDINPHRQGTFMAGTGQAIIAPAFLKDYRPDVVIVMNAIYVPEIKDELKFMGLSPKVEAL